MKIAIDVHSLGTQAAGNESYFRQLLCGLASDKTDNHYTLFYTHQAALQEITSDRRFSFVPIPSNPVARLCVSLPRLLAKLEPDVFHCQYVRPPFGKTRTVVSIHDLAYEHFPEFFHPMEVLRMKTLVRATARRADHILTVSQFSAHDISDKYRIAPEKITVTYLAAADRFRPREKQLCRQHVAQTYGIDGPFILYVGRIQARKNLPRLVEAYARVQKQGVTAKLVLVGRRDWQYQRLFAKIHQLGLRSSVVFPGYVSADDLPLFYNAAEVFVFPSVFEGFGLPVVESMASGVPTITSYGSSLEEVAGDGAVLVDPFDVSSIADAIQRILGDSSLQNELVTRGLRRSSEFVAEDLSLKALDVYRSV